MKFKLLEVWGLNCTSKFVQDQISDDYEGLRTNMDSVGSRGIYIDDLNKNDQIG